MIMPLLEKAISLSGSIRLLAIELLENEIKWCNLLPSSYRKKRELLKLRNSGLVLRSKKLELPSDLYLGPYSLHDIPRQTPY